MSRLEYEFANDLRAAADAQAVHGLTLPIVAIAALVAVATAWALWATVDEVTTGVGRVIPSRQLQVVQSLEGGIIQKVQVQEGQRVDAQQPLIQIDDTGFAARLGEMTTRRAALRAEVARLEAEASGATDAPFAVTLGAEANSAVPAEARNFQARRARFESELTVLRQQLEQRQQELIELNTRGAKLDAVLRPLKRELQLNQQLYSRGVISELEVLRLERQLAEAAGELDLVRAATPRAQTAILEGQSRLEGARAAFVAQAREKLTMVTADLAVIEESIKAASDRVNRTVLRSPVRGIVNKLHVTTIGAVVQPSNPLVEIVPLDDTLLIEARVRPQDVAFISPDQAASVKLSAYDFLTYGALEGRVERIGADTIADARGETFYQVIVRTERNYLGSAAQKLSVIPGMVATVDIQTGRKTVMEYILKPVLRARHEALRER